jgi:hypothetical protein
VGKPNERDFIQLQESYISNRNTIFQQEKSLTATQNCPHNMLSWKTCPMTCMTCTTQLNNTQKFVPRPYCTENTQNRPQQQRKILNRCLRLHAARLPQKQCTFSSVVRTVRIRIVQPPNQQQAPTLPHSKMSWDLCPISLGKSTSFAALSSSSYLLEISLKKCLAHNPRFTLKAEK